MGTKHLIDCPPLVFWNHYCAIYGFLPTPLVNPSTCNIGLLLPGGDRWVQRNRLAWPHRRRGLASDGVRYAGAQSSFGRQFQSATKLKVRMVWGSFLIAAAALKTPTRTGYNAQGVNLTGRGHNIV